MSRDSLLILSWAIASEFTLTCDRVRRFQPTSVSRSDNNFAIKKQPKLKLLMDIYTIERFCERWIDKANAYKSNDPEDLFDKFFTLFVAYNRYYSAASELYRATIDPWRVKMLQGDRQEATTVMSRLIGQSRFTEVVRATPELDTACQTIAGLIQDHRFFLHSVRGTKQPDLERDARLASGLRKCDLLAVLQFLYQIRCNIFHGEKEFAPGQAELLVPAVVLLEAIVSMSRPALSEAALLHAAQERFNTEPF